MIKCTIDDTGEVFNSLAEVAKVIGVSRQYVQQCSYRKAKTPNRFYCGDYGITVISYHSNTKKAKYMRNYYAKRREKCKQFTSYQTAATTDQ